jgi:uncharacterized protein
MSTWLPLTNIPAEGRELAFDDQGLWTGPCEEFGMPCRITEPIRAGLFVLPQKRGVYLRGRLTGKVVLPCDRCTEDVAVDLDQAFELVDELPAEEAGPGAEAEHTWLRRTGEGLELDVAGLLWEQFVLALPLKPLCDELCKGLCPSCGVNLNAGPCTCAREGGDPRMAALRGLKIDASKK